jgi:hypothetical protein
LVEVIFSESASPYDQGSVTNQKILSQKKVKSKNYFDSWCVPDIKNS